VNTLVPILLMASQFPPLPHWLPAPSLTPEKGVARWCPGAQGQVQKWLQGGRGTLTLQPPPAPLSLRDGRELARRRPPINDSLRF
jgi:hypothetical protein